MPTKIEKIFEELGLNPKEAQLMTILFQHESLKVSLLAKKAHLNRTTAYGLLKNLIQKGLVTTTNQHKTTEFQSIDPDILPTYIERQKDLLEKNKKKWQGLLPEIKKMRGASELLPHVTFFDGIEGVKQAYEDSLQNNKEKYIRCLSGPDAINQTLGAEYIKYYVNKRARLGIQCIGLAADSPFVQLTQSLDNTALRVTKIIPKEYRLDIEMVIYDQKVAMFSFQKDKPVAIIIEDEAISNSMKTLFRYLIEKLNNKIKS